MTSLAGRHPVAIAQRIVAAWHALGTRLSPVAVIIVAWAVLSVPLIFFRGYNSDEGLAVSIARTALENGDWLDQHTFNVRWVDSPRLLAWIIAAISEPFGHVSQIAARLPIVLFLLFGCLLIYFLLRKVGAGVAAALFGTALFLACPLVMRGYVMITADMPLAVLLFLAFVLWWERLREGLRQRRPLAGHRPRAGGGRVAEGTAARSPILRSGSASSCSPAARGGKFPGLLLAGLICAIPLALWYAAIYRPGDEGIWAAFMRRRIRNIIFSGPLDARA